MPSEPTAPLKGILKKTTPTHTSTPALPTPSPRNDPRTVALHHATLLQTRKDTEAAILTNLLALLDLPQHPSHPASSPHPDDIAAFHHLLRPFQPSDYDDLITERNLADNRCGYALCPRPRRRFPGAGTYKMINKGRRDFDIVETRELERWCSTECTRRALWIKVQLNETAAWERVGLPELKIELYPEKETGKAGDSGAAGGAGIGGGGGGEQGIATDQREHEQDCKIKQDHAILAVERGDSAKDASLRSIELVIREKKVVTQAEAPSLGDEPVEGGAIEGYKPRFGGDTRDDAEQVSAGEDWISI